MLKPEILDSLPPEEARGSLSDLVRINRVWGGHATLRRLLGRVVRRGEAFSLLDVGAASGDMGLCAKRWYPHARIVSVDHVASHLDACQGARVAGDAFRLPFQAHSFDYVFCSLFLHHFDDSQVVDLLREFGRVARRGVLVIDMERHPIPYYFIPWTRRILGWDEVTVHDAPISVEAAFRAAELEELARRAGLGNPLVRTHRPAFRLAMAALADPA